MKPKTIAQQGTTRYLVHVRGTLRSDDAMGQVVDVPGKEIFPEFPIQSTLARGYWEDPSRKSDSATAVVLVEEYGHLAVDDSYVVLA